MYLTRNSPGITLEPAPAQGMQFYHSVDNRKCGYHWKLDVGAQCNQMLALAGRLEAESARMLNDSKVTKIFEAGDLASELGNSIFENIKAQLKAEAEQTAADATSLRDLVERVASFEKLETED